MRISTLQISNSAMKSILDAQKQMNNINNAIASGKKVEKLSDDPISASRIISLKQQIGISEQYNKNAILVNNSLEQQDGQLKNIGDVIQRVRELQLTAMNSTLQDEDRISIKQELQSRFEELIGIANTKDASGRYIYSGYQDQVMPYTANNQGKYEYKGDNGTRVVEISAGLKVQSSLSGQEVFESIRSGNGNFSVTDPGANNTGTGVVKVAEVTDQASYVKETYTVTFVTNGAGDLAYQVFGSASGQLVPALPSATPANAPVYEAGTGIQFSGVNMVVEGTPAVGDNFELSPSTNQSLFTTIENIIATLDRPIANSTDRARFENEMNNSLTTLDQGLQNVINIRSEVGSRLGRLEIAENLNEDFVLQSKATLSSLEDIDLTDAVMQLNAQSVVLQATQQSYLRLQSLSLVNLL